MKYRTLKTGTPKERYDSLKKYKCWYHTFIAEGVVEDKIMSYEKVEAIKDFLMSDHDLGENTIKQLATFAIYVDALEIRSHFEKYLEHVSKNNKFGPSLENFILRYGEKEGTIRYAGARAGLSERGKRGYKTRYYFIDRGYSEDDATRMVSENSRAAALSRTPESYQGHNKKLKISKDYLGYVGLPEDVVEELRKQELAKISHDLESCIERYGEELGPIRYLEIKDKRRKTKEENYGSVSFMAGRKGKASKESLKRLFEDVCSVIDEKYPNLDYRIGNDDKSEYWLRDDSNNYFFYDFTIPELNLIVEYNGVQWHYRDDETWETHAVLRDKKEQIREKDEKKLLIAKEKGYTIMVVWSDVDMETAKSDILQLIEDRIDGFAA